MRRVTSSFFLATHMGMGSPPSPPSASPSCSGLRWCATTTTTGTTSSDLPPSSSAAEIALSRMKRRDLSMKVVSKCGKYRISTVTTTNLLQTVIDKHDLHGSDAPFLNLLGTHMTFTNLLAAMGEGEERVECRFESQYGAACVTESLALGECRAYVAGGSSEMVLPNTLVVKRALYNHRTPVTSATSASFDSELPEDVLRDCLRFMGGGSGWDNHDAQSASNDHLWTRYAAPATRRAQQGFHLNLTPHAVHYFRQSEGIPSAVLLTTSVEDAPQSKQHEADETSTKKQVLHSGGILVQPIAHSIERNNDIPPAIKKLQRLFNGMALCPVPPTVGSVAMAAMDFRNTSEGLLMMDLLSLASGDYKGALAATQKARVASSDDVETTETQYQLIRDPYGLKSAPTTTPTSSSTSSESSTADAEGDDGTYIALNTETVVRTPLDFTCRCSSDSFRSAILSLPETKKEFADEGVSATCIFCNKDYVVSSFSKTAVPDAGGVSGTVGNPTNG